MQEIELLAPAKNAEYGIEAIRHGADAVYIGADHHGARSAACNSIEDIEKLCVYAHAFMARVYVTLNTLVYDNEMEDVLNLIRKLAEIKVDALLLQDMGIVKKIHDSKKDDALAYFKNRMHASTQTDNRTSEKVEWLGKIGFSRVVLAREVSLEEMRLIHKQNKAIELEAFVHGALCVSFSGLCYASQHCFKRSANRGECAQFCRMKFDLTDSNGQIIEHDKHMLSLKDMCQIENIEAMIQAGVKSFKIEGRLKDLSYIKNVVAAYDEELNRIVCKYGGTIRRSSIGHSEHFFAPDLRKTFNRGYTSYFLHGRIPNISSPDSPKAVGKYIGRVKEIKGNSFSISTIEVLSNGDGLCFLNNKKELVGFRANRVSGNRVFPFKMPAALAPGTEIFRNSDQAFEKKLSGVSAKRTIPIALFLSLENSCVKLKACCDSILGCEHSIAAEAFTENVFDSAQKPQKENITRQLLKLGNTNYSCIELNITDDVTKLFIPSSCMSELRRNVIEQLDKAIVEAALKYFDVRNAEKEPTDATKISPKAFYSHGYCYNIANKEAIDFYEECGLKNIEAAYELAEPKEAVIMQCKYCIRYALGHCAKNCGKETTWKEPLYLVLGDGRKFKLAFDCKKCVMSIISDDGH